jgi:hypothetical protein
LIDQFLAMLVDWRKGEVCFFKIRWSWQWLRIHGLIILLVVNEIASTYELKEVDFDPWNARQLATELIDEDGINAVEHGKFNLCYLGGREQLRKFGSVEEMEREVLWQNPILKTLFTESNFLFDKPEVINEINFEPKKPVENHVLMAGDSAGLITPLCGNGMAMAIHAGKLAAEAILGSKNRKDQEFWYESKWRAEFENRLWVGRTVQNLFGAKSASVLTRKLLKYAPFIAQQIIKNTHGRPF